MPKWTADMDQAVIVMYPNAYTGDVALGLGVSVSAVRQRARKLGVRKSKRLHGVAGQISARVHERGYIVLYFHGMRKRVFEHRYVAEKMLRRKLDKREVVHHVNGDNTDNRRGNLRVFKSRKVYMRWLRRNPHRLNPIRFKPQRKITNNKLRCGKCKKTKPLHCFSLDSSTICGYANRCKDCIVAVNRHSRETRT